MNILSLILIFLISIIVTWVFKDSFSIIFKSTKERMSVVSGFWWIVSILITISIFVYVLVFNYSLTINLDRNLSILNTAVTLIFAVFIGYYAFLQVAEGRAEKNIERGREFMSHGRYVGAMNSLNSAIVFKLKDFSVTAELLELYLINNEMDKFNSLLRKFELKVKNNHLDKYDCLILFYLKITKACFDGNGNKAKDLIKEAVKYTQKYPDAINPGIWNFKEIKDSKSYKDLEVTGDLKKYIDNFILFITNSLPAPEKRDLFISGDFRLD